MKKSLLFFVTLIFSGLVFSQSIFESEPPPGFEPDTRIDNMGYWTRLAELGIVPRNPEIPFRRAEMKGSRIVSDNVRQSDSPDVAVTSASNTTQSENSIFTDPSDNTHVLNSNNSTSWSGGSVGTLYGANYFYSFDSGSSWGGTVQGAGGSNSGDPATAISLSGRQYIGYIYNGGQGVSYSTNGTSWTAVQVAPQPSGWNTLLDKNHLWIDNSSTSPYEGNVYDVWTNIGGTNDGDIEFSRTTNGGVSWSSVINISSSVNAGSHNQGVNIKTGPNGEVYVLWVIYDSWPADENALGFAKSTNGGSSFSSYRIINNIRGIRNSETSKSMRVNSFPCLAVDISGGAYNGHLYAVWANIGTPGSNSENDIGIYMIKSTDGGNNWSTPVRINQSAFNVGNEAFFPWIVCDPVTGYLSVVFYDDRNVSSSQCETWVANSLDGGATWDDFRVSDVAFTPAPISGLASDYFGDYLGISARDGMVYPCWTDNRSGTALTYVSPYELVEITNNTWDGSTSTDWNTASNWSTGNVPDAYNTVSIPSSAPRWPVYSGNLSIGTDCRSITIADGGQMTITGDLTIGAGQALSCNGAAVINVGGDWTNNGTFTEGSSQVVLNGNSNSLIYGVPVAESIFYDDFESDLGWTMTGEFQRGAPQGLGGNYGNPDPSSAFQGSNVLGVDLTGLNSYSGDYETSLGDRAYQAISPTINCTGYSNVSFNFQRWLNVERNTYDNAYIDVSNDNGATWNNVFANGGSTITDNSWSEISYDISTYADDQPDVKIRFCIGSTDGSWQYSGWNIDEFEVTGTVDSQTFYDLTIDKSEAEVSNECNLIVQNDFIAEPDASFTLSSGRSLTVNGNFHLKANNTGMASFINYGSLSASNDQRVDQYLISGNWHFVSPPISNAQIEPYLSIYLKEWDEATAQWSFLVEPLTLPMYSGQGYSAWTSESLVGTTTVAFEGTLNNTDLNLTLDYTPASSQTGWNLVGNPYPCALNWNGSTNWNLSSTIGGWAVVISNGIYQGWNALTSTGWNGKTDGIIPSTNGFWLRATGTSPAPTITLPLAERTHDYQNFYKGGGDDLPMLRLMADNGNLTDEFIMMLHPDATTGFDGKYDLEKMQNITEAPQIYAVASTGDQFAVHAIPEIPESKMIPVNFETGQSSAIELQVSGIESLEDNLPVYLYDKPENQLYDLRETASLSFQSSPEDDPDRFILYFTDPSIISENDPDNLLVYADKGLLHVKNPNNLRIEQLRIFEITGKTVIDHQKSTDQNLTIPLNVNNSILLIRIQTEKGIVTKKLILD